MYTILCLGMAFLFLGLLAYNLAPDGKEIISVIIVFAVIAGVGYFTWNKSEESTSQSEQQYRQEQNKDDPEAQLEALRQEDPIEYALTINQEALLWDDAKDYIGEEAIICGYVEDVDTTSANANPIFVDIGGTYPDDRVTGVIWPENQSEFPDIEDYEGKLIYMEGELYDRDGIPNINLKDSDQIDEVE